MTFHWTDRSVREALGLPAMGGGPETAFAGVSTDSRTVSHRDLFVALSGDRFDGHDFVEAALAYGAAGVVVEEGYQGPTDSRFFVVTDTLEALGALALHRREALGAKVVGITGSSGKTSTKDLLKAALEGSFRVHATAGNLNNRIGLPLTLLAAEDDADAVVLEMGTNEPGEIRALTSVARPHVGVITTVSETHLEKLGTVEGVLDEKLDLLRGLLPGGVAVVGDDPALLEEKARDVAPQLLVTGWSERVDPENRPEKAQITRTGCYRFFWRGEAVQLRMPGRHAVQNALVALAVADVLGVPAGEAAGRVGTVEAGGMRSEVRTLGSLTLVVDCYNANPQSLKAAMDLLGSMEAGGRRVAVLGSMLELGPESRAIHRRSLEDVLTGAADLVLATGLFAEVAEEAGRRSGGTELVVAESLDEALDHLLQTLAGTEVVLLKASRGVAMESLIPALEDRFGPGRAA